MKKCQAERQHTVPCSRTVRSLSALAAVKTCGVIEKGLAKIFFGYNFL